MVIPPDPARPQAGPAGQHAGHGGQRRGRRRRPALWLVPAAIGLVVLTVAGYGIYGRLAPRTFTAAQRHRIRAWEVAGRWQTTPESSLFPAVVHYQLPGNQIGSPGSLGLVARRLLIARQSSCPSVAGASKRVRSMLAADGCQAVLRASYTDATGSLVLTVGVAVLKSPLAATGAAARLAGSPVGEHGTLARYLLLRPVPVPRTPAHDFGVRQRQLSWVANAGPYLVIATVGYADGRPTVPVSSDSYTYLEMTSLADGVTTAVAGPLGAPAPVPHCPGNPAC